MTVPKLLKEDFSERDAVGPVRVAHFMAGGRDDDIQADVVGFVLNLLSRCEST